MSEIDNTESTDNGQKQENDNSSLLNGTLKIDNRTNNPSLETIRSVQQGFQTTHVTTSTSASSIPVTSKLAPKPALEFAQMVELESGEGVILYYPKKVDFDIGDVLYLRERGTGENGLIVQAVEKSTANYPQVDSKALFRLLTSVRASQIQRSHNEPPEVIDEFLALRFKVRAAIVNRQWSAHEGRVVTRNVDIFQIDPQLLLKNIIITHPSLSLELGDYKGEPLRAYGGGLEKVNVVTGMKGGGKSHITKGIISESLKLNMSAVIFDINNEYEKVDPNTLVLRPKENIKFRLDILETETLFRMIDKLAPFSEKTAYAAYAKIPDLIEKRKKEKRIPDLPFLKQAEMQIVPGTAQHEKNMRDSYVRSLDILENYNLIMTEAEAQQEDAAIKSLKGSNIMSLRTAFNNMLQGKPQALVFQIGGLTPTVQKVVVNLVLDHLKTACDRQKKMYENGRIPFPIYPTVFFEEAHMYMEERDIDDLIPVIRHIGINVFFITNTPGALPDSVFRLLDNLIMTRLINRKDIDRLVDCGLADKETIEDFAQNLRDYHALFLSAKNGVTQNFPLVFHVRDFGLPQSGQTRSQWEVMRSNANSSLNPSQS